MWFSVTITPFTEVPVPWERLTELYFSRFSITYEEWINTLDLYFALAYQHEVDDATTLA